MLNKVIKLSNEQIPKLTTYVLDGNKPRGAVLVLPGGGYGFTSPREAEPIALKFNSAGFHAFVLDYSCAPLRHPAPLIDVTNAIKLIFDQSETWKIDTKKIAVCGFSAGGHLAASYGIYWEKFGDFKPNALILSYPVINSGEFAHRDSFINLLGEHSSDDLLDQMSLEKHINKNTPPTFIWHTVEDNLVPVENTLMFANGLRIHNIPFEMHIYPNGGHGLSLAIEETADHIDQINPHVATWMSLCITWLVELFNKGE
ncbi:MAG: acetyl esterase [Haloplasmataceae bacterium]|jgi:acetyl esterase/lipase|nr:acetyl esterase [Haloplasmataceae bacterium]